MSKNSTTTLEKVPFPEKIAYGLGDAGCNFVWTTVGMFLTLYYTDSVGIAAGVVGTIMMLTRLLDGVSDLVMGTIVDHTHTRWGKARPWVGLMAPFMGLGLIFLFNVPTSLSDTGKIAYASVTYVLLAVVIYTACNLSYGTLPCQTRRAQTIRGKNWATRSRLLSHKIQRKDTMQRSRIQ